MKTIVHHAGESASNRLREQMAQLEPAAQRTYTPTQAVLARSAGIYHWTAGGRRLYDFTSGVLVANLGHNPTAWMKRFVHYMDWPLVLGESKSSDKDRREVPAGFFAALPMTAYNAVTSVETAASQR